MDAAAVHRGKASHHVAADSTLVACSNDGSRRHWASAIDDVASSFTKAGIKEKA
jgi:hypothetical protein